VLPPLGEHAYQTLSLSAVLPPRPEGEREGSPVWVLLWAGRACQDGGGLSEQAGEETGADLLDHDRTKMLELRAVTSLSRLWQSQGKKTAAQQMLAEIYGWFTEGFETTDLREARTLLEELG